jgi:TM2 domain-containing membrane protein YozV
MKISYKATLLSAFVFPGVGQFYLKRYRQGLIIMAVTLAGLVYIVWQATILALRNMDSILSKMQGGNSNIKELTAMVGSNPSEASLLDNAVPFIIICCWIIAVADAYYSGKRKEREQTEPAKS